MIKTTMSSYCKKCKKPVVLYEEIKDKYEKQYYCGECRKHVRTVTTEKE